MGDLCLTARGMASSLGHDVVSSCAAARAGIARGARGGEVCPFPLGGNDIEFVVHAVRDKTRGFDGAARLAQIVAATFDDLVASNVGVSWDGDPTPIYVSLPDPRRRTRGLARMASPEAREWLEADLDPMEHEDLSMDLAHELLARGVALSSWPGRFELRGAVGTGHTGFARALASAREDLDAGRIERALVCGFDTLLTARSLTWLYAAGRLKAAGDAVGLMPGEGGAACLLELQERAARPGSKTHARLTRLEFAEETASYVSGAAAEGRGIATLLGALGRASDERGPLPPVYADQNGETYRASDWGIALVRAAAKDPRCAALEVVYPVMSFGDVGAASGAFHSLLLVHAMERDPMSPTTGWVLGSADGGDRSVIVWSAANARHGGA